MDPSAPSAPTPSDISTCAQAIEKVVVDNPKFFSEEERRWVETRAKELVDATTVARSLQEVVDGRENLLAPVFLEHHARVACPHIAGYLYGITNDLRAKMESALQNACVDTHGRDA